MDSESDTVESYCFVEELASLASARQELADPSLVKSAGHSVRRSIRARPRAR